MSDGPDPERLRALDERLSRLRDANAPKPHMEEHYSKGQLAWRMVIELVAGIAIGFGMGYGLDLAFGTMPIFLVLFTLLGFAAGVKTMLRSAEEVQARNTAETADGTDGATPPSERTEDG